MHIGIDAPKLGLGSVRTGPRSEYDASARCSEGTTWDDEPGQVGTQNRTRLRLPQQRMFLQRFGLARRLEDTSADGR